MNHLIISKLKDSPQIEINITEAELQIKAPLAACIRDVAQQIGNPSLIFTQTSLEKAMTQAFEATIKKLKDETARVI